MVPPALQVPVAPRLGRSIAVLGAGLAGLAAAQALSRAGYRVALYEKNAFLGGHASSHQVGGFLFDEGPHVSFTKRPEIQTLLADAVHGNYLEHHAALLNYWHGQPIPHPVQCHLHGLPVDLVERCLLDFVEAQKDNSGPPTDYAAWCRRSLGRAFSEEFTFRYTRKYWTAEAEQLATDWVGSRIYPPKLGEMIRGALSPQQPNFHYISRFRYPTHGGFGAYVRAVAPETADVHLKHEVALIDLDVGRLEFADGRAADFDLLVSSLPLPVLISRIKDVPGEVAAAARRLVCTSVVLVNVGVERDEGFPEAHWAYVYDEDLLPSRIHFPHRLAPSNVPPGCGSIQAEVYFSPYRPLSCTDVLGRTLENLGRLGLVRQDDRLAVAQEQVVPFANVLFDHARTASLAMVQGWLAQQNVFCCGRYGEWAYYWTDDSILSGWRAAEAAATALARPR